MNRERAPKLLPTLADIELACDSDLSGLWEKVDPDAKNPRRSVTVSEAMYVFRQTEVGFDPTKLSRN